jgi:very-short-patch-repair endonuclease
MSLSTAQFGVCGPVLPISECSGAQRGVRSEDLALHELAASSHQLVDIGQVRAAGMSMRQWRWRVSAGEWVEVVPGVWRHAATPETFEVRVRAGSMALGREGALTGGAAAAWWGLDGFDATSEPVMFVVSRARRWRASVEVRTTRDWRPRDLLWRDGVRVVNVTRLVLDLAEMGESARRLEAAIDSGVRLRHTSLPTLVRRIGEAGRKGRQGVPLLRELMLDSGGESALERRFLRLMRDHQLPRPAVQVAYRRESSRATRVDFEFPCGVVVEVGGRLGHTSDRDRQRDARRRNALQQSGRQVLEFTTADVVEDPLYVCATVEASLRAHRR